MTLIVALVVTVVLMIVIKVAMTLMIVLVVTITLMIAIKVAMILMITDSRGGALNFFPGRGVRPGFPKCGACELTFASEKWGL